MKYIEFYSKEELENIIKNSISFRDFMRKIGYTHNFSGATYKAIKKYLADLNIEFRPMLGEKRLPCNSKDIFCKDSKVSQRTLRSHYLELTKDDYICDICGQLPFWNDKPLTLILDHINGICNDNRLENLHWVCPNCNQQLETTGFRKFRVKKTEKEIKKYYCISCGAQIATKKAKFCQDCMHLEQRRCIRPDKETLLNDLIAFQNFTKIGNKYGVSDNAIRKWCRKYDLPANMSSLKELLNKNAP